MKPTWMFVIFAAIIITSFSNATGIDSRDCELSLQQIMDDRASCVREIIGDKVYLNYDNISISEKGIHVLLNDAGDFASIPFLRTDAAGCFILFNLTSMDDYMMDDYRTGDWANNYKKECPECGWRYHTSCPNPNCPRNKNK